MENEVKNIQAPKRLKKFKVFFIILFLIATVIFLYISKNKLPTDIIKEVSPELKNHEVILPIKDEQIILQKNKNFIDCANFVDLISEAYEIKFLLQTGRDFSLPLAKISLLLNNEEAVKFIDLLSIYASNNRLNLDILKAEFNHNVNNIIASYNYNHSENKILEKFKFYLSKLISVRKTGSNAINDSGIEEIIFRINKELDLGNILKAKELLESVKDFQSVHASIWINKVNSYINANNNVLKLIDFIKLHNQCGKTND